MTQTLQNFPGLGNVISLLDPSDGTTERNNQFVGGTRCFESLDRDVVGSKPLGLDDGAWIHAILLRNNSGGVLLPGRLARLNDAGSGQSDLYTEAEGYGNAAWLRTCVLIDPWLPAAGVPAGQGFWGIFKGPAEGYTPQATGSLLSRVTAGSPVFCSADAQGRVTGPKATPASATEAYQQAISVLGTAQETISYASVDTKVWVYWDIPVFG